jgi:hypothetical protein
MILLEHKLSSCVQEVTIAPREKGIGLERRLPEDCGTGRRDTAFGGVVRGREYRNRRLEWMIHSGGTGVVLAGPRDNNVRFSRPG